MQERSQEDLVINEISHLLVDNTDTVLGFKERLDKGGISRAENSQDHFCIFFIAYDSQAQKVFLGNHKKSGLWIFNGGHVDRGETLRETVIREIEEEWGMKADNFAIEKPEFLTTMFIENPNQICKRHFDIWYFIDVDIKFFDPDQEKLSKETYETRWLDLKEARQIVTDKNTLLALDFIENKYFQQKHATRTYRT